MIRLIVALCFASWALVAAAGEEVDLYRVEALVTSQAEAERNRAAREALAELLVRVSGDSQAPSLPPLAAALRRPASYLHEFRYASSDQQLEVDGQLRPASLLVLRFSPQAIERLLRESGVPFWPANRPRLLIWSISQDEMGTYHRVPEDEALKSLRQRSRVRGQPLRLPEQDFEDRIALTNESLWELDAAEIRQASERYQADAVLAGRYQPAEDGTLQASWLLIEDTTELPFDDSAATPAELFARVLDAAADYFARRYAIVPGDADDSSVVMRIEGIHDFASYKQLQQYLEGLAMVRRLELLQVDRQSQLLRLSLDGDQSLLLKTLELGRRLLPISSAPDSSLTFERVLEQGLPLPEEPQSAGSLANPLVFRWQP